MYPSGGYYPYDGYQTQNMPDMLSRMDDARLRPNPMSTGDGGDAGDAILKMDWDTVRNDPNYEEKLDPEIIPLCDALNRAGFSTTQSCCGHGLWR